MPSIGDHPSLFPVLNVIGGRRVGCAARTDSWRPRLAGKGGDLFLLDVTIHVGHKDDAIASCLPGRDSEAKVMEEGHLRLAGVSLAE